MDLTDAKPGSTVYLPVDVPGALLSIGDIHAIMSRGESSFVAIEAQGTAIVSVDLIKGVKHRAPRIEIEDEWIFIGLGNPVQESIQRGYEDVFDFLVEDNGYSHEDAYVVMSALAHSELGGPTGSENGEQIAANKVKGARCALAWSEETAKLAREYNNAQLIGIGGRMHTEEEALAIVDAFVSQPWSDEERHQRRIDILAEYERTGVAPQP